MNTRMTEDAALARGWLVRVRQRAAKERTVFPFSVGAIQSLEALDFSGPVSLFVGENGSGKSTLMEALAIATKLPTVGSVSGLTWSTGTDPNSLASWPPARSPQRSAPSRSPTM